ncbi:hypothetical protein MDA_GLEAN10015624 [Myotis davidii]|uniref:Uncharacterized protein n=1 Tax=Myotis davidii TaxID=225400 RepID=L5MGX7_MYODS|nr:hypothetical protein MDA_GLEAN10015624 [Myotis davidii]
MMCTDHQGQMLNAGAAMTCTGHLKINGTRDLVLPTNQHSASPKWDTGHAAPPWSNSPPNRSHHYRDPMAQNAAYSPAQKQLLWGWVKTSHSNIQLPLLSD